MYKCLYNLELMILATGRTPFQSYDEPIRSETPANYVRQLQGTDVDVLMLCPTACRLPLWDSDVEPHWKKEAPMIEQPYFTADLKYYEKAYFRFRDYMLKGNDPVGVAVNMARECGIAPFISYRMNDHHYLMQEKAVIHPTFWRMHPQFWISQENRQLDYMHEEVREYYFSLLEELVSRYDVAGLELDFMRSPCYFKEEQIEEGRVVMTEFVRKVRMLLDNQGKQKGKRLDLCVRIPYTTKWCWETGLDVERWDHEKLIDMVNVSTYYICSPKVDVKGYKRLVKNAALFGEIHYIVDKAKLCNGFYNNCIRRTTKEMYRALAATYLDQGMDGLSFFNVDYTRHVFFDEPRRLRQKCAEPPLEAFAGIAHLECLQGLDKHYFVGPNYSELPQVNHLSMGLYIADTDIEKRFKHAILRLRTEQICQELEIAASINGVTLEEMVWTGELFPPLTTEGAAPSEYVKYYRVPMSALRHGNNQVSAVNLYDDPTIWDKRAVYQTVELALYKNNSFLNKN